MHTCTHKRNFLRVVSLSNFIVYQCVKKTKSNLYYAPDMGGNTYRHPFVYPDTPNLCKYMKHLKQIAACANEAIKKPYCDQTARLSLLQFKRSALIQCLFQVIPDIFPRFQTHGQPDKLIGYSHFQPGIFRNNGMCHRSGMLH